MEEQPTIGVLALQGAFEEHQQCLEAVGCKTVQVRRPEELEGLDGIVLPGGESTAISLIGAEGGMWNALRSYVQSGKPTWGTCAGMILLAERCVGTSAVIAEGQALIGGMNVLVCRNYFGSQISSFEMATPPPPSSSSSSSSSSSEKGLVDEKDFPGVFIRAPAILSADEGVTVLGTVVASPHRQAAVVLRELERKIAAGEDVVKMEVVDALVRKSPMDIQYANVVRQSNASNMTGQSNQKKDEGQEEEEEEEEEKKDVTQSESVLDQKKTPVQLPGAADGTNAREVICAVRRDNILCTAFHPELTTDYRWHAYFVDMVRLARD